MTDEFKAAQAKRVAYLEAEIARATKAMGWTEAHTYDRGWKSGLAATKRELAKARKVLTDKDAK